jgi:molecular chaperone GrpE
MKDQKPQEAPLDPLKKELEHKTKESQDYLDHLKRLQADFENFIKRSDKERKDVVAFASEKLVLKLLTVLDEFEHTLDALRKSGTKSDIVQGIELLYKNFHKILSDEGVQPIESVGKAASPYAHEVVLTEPREGIADGIILEEFQKGYRMKDKVVRYAKVKVAKAKTGGK